MRAPALLSILIMASTLTGQDSEPLPPQRTLVDFGDDAEPRRWRTILDGVMGGRSSGEFEVEDGRMIFTGVLNTNGGGFSSVRRPGRDLQLGQPGEEGVWLRVRGDGRTYTLRLRQPSSSRRYAASYRSTFATDKNKGWQQVFVPYAALIPTWRGRQLNRPAVQPTRVDEIGLSIDDKIDGPFQIEIQQIGTYGSFAFDDYRDERRPLVVFARDANDPHLIEQRASVHNAAAGFAERDMALVVVLDNGDSFADARPLSADAADALRQRFKRSQHSSDDGFVVLLVGKDGGVKRAETTPVDAKELFAQIDQMPMRIRETRRQGDS